jgi:hypothetical protein
LVIEYTLKVYYSQVRHSGARGIDEVLHLPYDIARCCALCEAEDCAEFIGWYHREVIDEDGTYFKVFPIARFECHRKNGAPVVAHRTFSLLPYQLVPYVKYSLPFIIKGLRSVFGEGTSVKQLLDYLAASEEGYIDLSGSSFYRFRALLLRCIEILFTDAQAERG